MNLEMLDLLATIKELVQKDASPSSPEAFDVVKKMTELATKNIKDEDLEMFAEQLEKAQAITESEEIDFYLPNFFTSEEEAFIEDILKEMEALQNKKED
ncbi:hypothetical protein [Salicibibacter cibarius]|uniref:hypothetical protein n=1 Tax=Salicibibacter cibarius TaxID=2743000 RepID=UPI001FEBA35E|nr:hypothetical protein [Salicibibacter cibarius]